MTGAMETSKKLRSWRRRKVKRFFGRFIWSCERIIERNSLVPNEPVFNASEFEWAAVLEDNAKIILRECLAILNLDDVLPSFHELSPDQKSISSDDKWKTFFLYGMGHKAEVGCRVCPETSRVLESIPGMTTAFFSILSPGKHIPTHRGVFKGFIRCHLALVVPKQRQDCYMRVANARLQWESGRCLVFDDTYDHEVFNNTDEIRVVLLIDVLRPMRYAGRLLTRILLWLGGKTAYVTDARRNHDLWEQRLSAAWKSEHQG